jgi:TM2 domain-containing membrane protein YozV
MKIKKSLLYASIAVVSLSFASCSMSRQDMASKSNEIGYTQAMNTHKGDAMNTVSRDQAFATAQAPKMDELAAKNISGTQSDIHSKTSSTAPTAFATNGTHVKKANLINTLIAAKQAKKALRHPDTLTSAKHTMAGDNQLVALLLCFFLGGLGVHRFYLGYIWQGVVQLLTAGGCGIWVLIDFIRIILGTLKPKDGEYSTTL